MDGKPGDDYRPPKLFLTKSEEQATLPTTTRSSPRERFSSVSDSNIVTGELCEESKVKSTQTDKIAQEHVPMMFSHITRESDVQFFTGIPGPESFKEIFDIMLNRKRNT